MSSEQSQIEQMQRGSECLDAQAAFSSYLDGALSGVEMGQMADHLSGCAPCSTEFNAWRSMQTALGDLGPAKPPARLQERLQMALDLEREQGTHLALVPRIKLIWQTSVAPLAVQTAGGMLAALLLLASVFQLFGPGIEVQANDDGLAHLIAPRYIYSEVPPMAVETGRDVPVLIDAKVDTRGRVYDYTIIDGPSDLAVRRQVEQNLLTSVFKPATVFGVPVDGHVMLTYAGVSVRG